MNVFEAVLAVEAESLDWKVVCPYCEDELPNPEVNFHEGWVQADLEQQETYTVRGYRTDTEKATYWFSEGGSLDDTEIQETIEYGYFEVEDTESCQTEQSQMCPSCSCRSIVPQLRVEFLGSEAEHNSVLMLSIEDDSIECTGDSSGPAYEWFRRLTAVRTGEEVVPVLTVEGSTSTGSELDQLKSQLEKLK